MFNFIKKIRNKDNTPKKGYNLSYDNLAIPEIHINGQDDESPDMAVSKETEQDTEGVDKKKTHVTYEGVAVPEMQINKSYDGKSSVC